MESAATVGAAFKTGLEELQEDFPQVTNVRGRGLLLAFDMPDGDARDALRQRCWDAGFATLACGPRSVRFRPSLVFSQDDVKKSLGILRKQLM